jgi:hypothetical protein
MSDKVTQEISAFTLFTRFTSLRQTGVNRDEAWYQVCEEAPNITEVTRSAFLTLARNWERTEGHKFHYREEEDRDSTMNRKEVGDVAAAQQASITKAEQESTQSKIAQEPPQSRVTPPAQPALPNGNAALTGALDPGKLREQDQRRLEQLLDVLDDNRDVEMPRTVKGKAGGTAPMRHPDDFFGPNTVLLMYFKNYPHPLRVTIVGNDELYIGRSTANSAMAPEIDLNPVNAGDYGVSRLHAIITRQNNKLLIADLDSMNCTYINGVRAFPREPHTLHDGDEVWFGQLQCRIRFQHT